MTSCFPVPSDGASSCVYLDANSQPLRDATPFVSNASVYCAPGFAAANESGLDLITYDTFPSSNPETLNAPGRVITRKKSS